MEEFIYTDLDNGHISVPLAQAVLTFIQFIGYIYMNYQAIPKGNIDKFLMSRFSYKYLKSDLNSPRVEKYLFP